MIIGYQDWHDLLFLHWRVPPALLRPLVPKRLQIDQREGSAWVSMTPFTLRNGRLRGLPPLPAFHELNFRTYVTLPGGSPGIWFFCLEAASRAAVAGARLSVRLPYFLARMERGPGWFRSARPDGSARFEVSWTQGPALGTAKPGSLEEFLAERYSLYSRALGPVRWRGPVRHVPWHLHSVSRVEVTEELSLAAGLPALGPPALAHWSPGVAVEFQPIRPC